MEPIVDKTLRMPDEKYDVEYEAGLLLDLDKYIPEGTKLATPNSFILSPVQHAPRRNVSQVMAPELTFCENDLHIEGKTTVVTGQVCQDATFQMCSSDPVSKIEPLNSEGVPTA